MWVNIQEEAKIQGSVAQQWWSVPYVCCNITIEEYTNWSSHNSLRAVGMFKSHLGYLGAGIKTRSLRTVVWIVLLVSGQIPFIKTVNSCQRREDL